MSAQERSPLERTLEVLDKLVGIPSRSGEERRLFDHVAHHLEGLGLQVEEWPVPGAETGNLYGLLPGTAPGAAVLLSAHLDTVDCGPAPRFVRDGGALVSATGLPFGADDKGALAAILVALEEVVASGAAHGDVEILFTVREEEGARGVTHAPIDRLRSRHAFLFDIYGELGGVVCASPTSVAVVGEVSGVAAHASVPQRGRNAVLATAHGLVALDPAPRAGTTRNVGTILGGSGINVVPATCSFEVDVRGYDTDVAVHEARYVVETMERAAQDHGCRVDIEARILYSGYVLRPDTHEGVIRARSALTALGRDVSYIEAGGGSDANVLIAGGMSAVNLAFGAHNFHSPDERLDERDLNALVQVIVRLLAA